MEIETVLANLNLAVWSWPIVMMPCVNVIPKLSDRATCVKERTAVRNQLKMEEFEVASVETVFC